MPIQQRQPPKDRGAGLDVMRKLPVSLITACSVNRVIGRRGRLPWDLPADWAFFCSATRGQVLLVGRKSFEEFGQPVPNRHTIVVSSTWQQQNDTPGFRVSASLEQALQLVESDPLYEGCTRVFIGGGERLYSEAMAAGVAESCYVSRVQQHIADGDTFFPKWTTQFPTLAYSAKTGGGSSTRLKEMLATTFQFPSATYFHNEIAVNPPNMLPVLFLDVQRGHRVLDMCASPGSKTTQVIDFLLSSDSSNGAGESGLVVANDLDKKRAYMLVHRLTRNTLRRAIVTCGAGDTFPGLYDAEKKTLQTTNVFDRVLCDVPCSGDGTLRKNQALWKEWHIGQGLTLHPTQLALALRGAALLKVGGIMVYSTCSFNPVENEAVVAELLRRADGSLELLDVSQKLPHLVARPGRPHWRVGWRSKSKSTHKGHLFKGDTAEGSHDWFDSYDLLSQELRGNRVMRSMFPPEGAAAQELSKTLRLIPMDQNSGGFFIAVLRKKADLPGTGDRQEGLEPLEETEAAPPSDYVCKLCSNAGHFMKNCSKYLPDSDFAASTSTLLKPQKKKRRMESETTGEAQKTGAKKRETLYRPIGDDVWKLLREFYGLEDDSIKERFWCRSDTAATVNYVDKEIADACLGGDALDVFTKVSERGETFYRPSEESLGFFDDCLTKRRMVLPAADFSSLLHAKQHVSFDSLASDVQVVLADMPVGPAVARLQSNEHVRINIWIGKGSILPRVSKAMRGEVADALKRCIES
ncbi:hypothetical protein BBJ28_00008874 [Nothophytophthora sp. Chile5]|nr:hypothetical protein BBJ28_00008874 [Nothophytophthora sp. Chile5]